MLLTNFLLPCKYILEQFGRSSKKYCGHSHTHTKTLNPRCEMNKFPFFLQFVYVHRQQHRQTYKEGKKRSPWCRISRKKFVTSEDGREKQIGRQREKMFCNIARRFLVGPLVLLRAFAAFQHVHDFHSPFVCNSLLVVFDIVVVVVVLSLLLARLREFLMRVFPSPLFIHFVI